MIYLFDYNLEGILPRQKVFDHIVDLFSEGS